MLTIIIFATLLLAAQVEAQLSPTWERNNHIDAG